MLVLNFVGESQQFAGCNLKTLSFEDLRAYMGVEAKEIDAFRFHGQRGGGGGGT